MTAYRKVTRSGPVPNRTLPQSQEKTSHEAPPIIRILAESPKLSRNSSAVLQPYLGGSASRLISHSASAYKDLAETVNCGYN
jgi:hypothetical protein